MQQTYELVVLLHPDLEIDVEAPMTKIEKMIETGGGRIARRDNWGKKRLAYRIKRQDFAIYLYFEFAIDTQKIRHLESTILITEEIIRHIMVVHETPKPRELAAKKVATDKKPVEAGKEG